MLKLQSINVKRIRWNLKPNKKLKDLRKKRSAKYKDSESFKRKLLIDKLRLMHSEPREPSRKVREWPEKEKSSSKPKGKEFKLTSRKPDKSNSRRKLLPWLNRLEWREKTTCTKSRNKSKLNSKRERLRRIESKPLLTILKRLEARLAPTRKSRNKKDWTSWNKAERSERKSTWREKRSKISNRPKQTNSRPQEQTISISTSSTRRPCRSEQYPLYD